MNDWINKDQLSKVKLYRKFKEIARAGKAIEGGVGWIGVGWSVGGRGLAAWLKLTQTRRMKRD